MICIAAFIILSLLSVIIGILSLFKRDIGRKWWQIFKKAWRCVFKKVRLQKCDTNFKSEIKNSILKKFIFKAPHLVKPISILIEVIAVLIVFITIWSLLVAIKSLLSLWVFGICNVSIPSQCGLGAKACTIDAKTPTTITGHIARSFEEWGELFAAIPDKLKTWQISDYLPSQYLSTNPNSPPTAIDIFDPGCSICLQSYHNQSKDQFFSRHTTALLFYIIKNPDGTERFTNSTLIARYLYATHLTPSTSSLSLKILHRFFTEHTPAYINYQTHFQTITADAAIDTLNLWLKEWGATDNNLHHISNLINSSQITDLLNQINTIVETKLHSKSIPIIIYDGNKHNGLYSAKSP